MFYTAKVKRKFLTQRRGGAKYAERNKNLGTDPFEPLILLAIVGSVWYYIARRWTRRQYSGLKDCRVLEYDTGQQVSGKHLL